MKLSLAKVSDFISASNSPGTVASGQLPEVRNEVVQGYSIDSRTIRTGELFFAVQGERLDGHDFVEAALERGAAAAVVCQDHLNRYPQKSRLLVVEDTLVALQTLATA